MSPPVRKLTPAEIAQALRPPTEAEVAEALARFAAAVRAHYGPRLKGLYLFGSRARGDHRPDSDADVAVVLEDGAWEDWRELRTLAALAYHAGIDAGAEIQPWPILESAWRDLDGGGGLPWVLAARRHALPLAASR